MSDRNNDEAAGMGMALGLVGAMLLAVAIVVALVASFVCLVLTILCLRAWNEPLKLGEFVIEPERARAFVHRGFLGAGVVPAFALFCTVVLGKPQILAYMDYFVAGGYVAGSLGIEILMAAENEGKVQPPPRKAPPPPRVMPPPPREPFRYATWNDEEENTR